jgi:hypothetical protein
MNRLGKTSTTMACWLVSAALPLLFLLASCGGSDSGRPTPQPDADVVTPTDVPTDEDTTPQPDAVPQPDADAVTPDPDVETVTPDPDVETVTPDPDVETVTPDSDVFVECEIDDDCADFFDDLGPCDFAFCGAGNICERDSEVAPACCLVDADCDDGDPNTVNTCPIPGGACASEPAEQCTSDQWCRDRGLFDDVGICERVRCNFASGACYLDFVPANTSNGQAGCCEHAGQCDDGNSLTKNLCPTPGGACVYVPEEQCTINEVALHVSFDSGTLEGMQIFDWDTDDAVTWNVTRKNTYKGDALYLGDPECRWFYNGPRDVTAEGCVTEHDPVQDAIYATGIIIDLVSPDFTLRADTFYMLGFWIQGEGEPVDPMDVAWGWTPDNLAVYVEDLGSGDRTKVFQTADHNNFFPVPTFIAADLSAFAGRNVRLVFAFDSLGPEENRYEGWTIDEIKVRTACDEIVCARDADCGDDGNACTETTCTPYSNAGAGGYGVCAYNVVPSSCVPCFAGVADCNDGNPCTIDACIAGVCSWTPNPAPECCAHIQVVDDEFDPDTFPDVPGADFSWTIEEDGTTVKWQIVTDEDAEESYLYFGDPLTQSYNNGGVAQGRAIVGPVPLPDPNEQLIIHLVSRWELMLSTVFDFAAWTPQPPVDRLTLFVRYVNGEGRFEETEVWSSAAPNVEGSTHGDFRSLGVDLTEFAGMTVWFVWQFNSFDGDITYPGGVWLKNFVVETVCGDICTQDSDCDDGDACTLDACENLVCRNDLEFVGCCSTVADCLPGNDCTTVLCQNRTCIYQDDGDPNTCCQGVAWRDRFGDPNLTGYTVAQGDHGDPLSPVRWQTASFCAQTGSYGLYFGDAATQDYATPYRVSGSVTTPQFFVPSSGPGAVSWAQFDMFLDTEWSGSPLEGWEYPEDFLRDRLAVYAVQGAQSVRLWDAFAIDFRGSTCDLATCGWERVQIDLTAYQGYALSLRFEFDSQDEFDNFYLGACIDNLEIMTDCTADNFECFQSEQCDDGDDLCTWNFCVGNQCVTEDTGFPTCCYREVIHASNWDTGQAQGWEFTPAPGGAFPVAWQVANFLPLGGQTGQYFMYFGDPALETYDWPDQQVAGYAVYPWLTLPQSSQITLSFWYYADIEPWEPSNPSRDLLELNVYNNFSGAEQLLWHKSQIPSSVLGVRPIQWTRRTVDLTAFAGENVAFEFTFESGDPGPRTGMGVLIDNWQIEAEICP